MRLAWLIARRELREVLRDYNLLLPIIFMPSLMGVLAGISAFGSASGGTTGIGAAIGTVALQQLPESSLRFFGNLPRHDQAATIETLLKALGIPLFWVIPVALTSAVAADSFVGEKERETIEPLLATPISDRQLFAGKLVAAVVPAVLGTWLGMAVFVVLVLLANSPFYPRFILGDRDWAFSTFVIAPLLALLSAGVAAVISTRAASYRAAYQLNSLVVLPVILILIPQTLIMFLLTSVALFYVAGAIAVADVVMVAWALRIFDRERLLRGT